MKKPNYRHGDVLIRRVQELPQGLTRHKDLTLAYGEATGHHHTVIEGQAVQYRDAASGGIWLEVLSDTAVIDHPEHGRGCLDRGVYEIDIQQGWQEDGWTKVID